MDKKNNKGFTLIEILAAVTILAIISTVVVVSVVRYINKSRNSVYETMEKSICDAASNYVINENLETEVTEAGDEGITYEGKKLMADKYLEDLTDPRNKKKNCKASVNIKVLNSDDSEMGISEYAYNVKLKCSRYSSTVDFTQGCAVKNRTVENTPDDTDDDPIAPDIPDPSNPAADNTLLYNIVANETKGLDTDVSFKFAPTVANSGVYTRVGTETGQYPVHYYRGIIDNNNVLFADFCWKMVRTTDTGGVKLIYNGVPSSDNSCNNTRAKSQIGTSSFNFKTSSPADVGYMFGVRYEYNTYEPITIDLLSVFDSSSNTNYYGTSVKYSNGRYTLVNASRKNWSNDFNKLVGYYTCRSSSTTCTTVYYIVGGNNINQYSIPLSGGVTDPATQTITLGKKASDNGDGTYSLNEIVTVEKSAWYSTHNMYKGYYICRDLTSTTCENKNIITATGDYKVTYDRTFNYIYGNDVTWNGTKYTLIDTVTSTNFWATDRNTLAKKYHYTCFNTTGECTDVYYIHYFGDLSSIWYLTLTSGKNIEMAKEAMFANTNSSEIKQKIDTWYASNMVAYTEKLEDTIWCNDRTFSSGSLVGKDMDSGTKVSSFGSYSRVYTTYNLSLVCPNSFRDGFSVSTTSGGNGALIYPIGLLTADEVKLAGGGVLGSFNVYLNTRVDYWLLSPYDFYYINTRGFGASDIGFSPILHAATRGVRPAISVAYGARAISGDGTVNNPYIVE